IEAIGGHAVAGPRGRGEQQGDNDHGPREDSHASILMGGAGSMPDKTPLRVRFLGILPIRRNPRNGRAYHVAYGEGVAGGRRLSRDNRRSSLARVSSTGFTFLSRAGFRV